MLPFKTQSTADVSLQDHSKVLLYAHHGFGKTYQARHYQNRYGSGLILSGESGLKSVADVNIPYLPFTSWDGAHDPDNGVYSFKGIARMLTSSVMKSGAINWIALDSLTELSERLQEHLNKEFPDEKDKFKYWAEYDKLMTGTLKWIRDLPVHVYVSCLAKEEEDDSGRTHYWPLVKGQAVSKKIPAIFDHVLCGVRQTEPDASGAPKVKRYVFTDEVGGWHGKVRDPRGRVKAIEPGADITELLARMSMTDEEFARLNANPAA